MRTHKRTIRINRSKKAKEEQVFLFSQKEEIYEFFFFILRKNLIRIKNPDSVKMWVDSHILTLTKMKANSISAEAIKYYWWRKFDNQVNLSNDKFSGFSYL